VFFPLRAKRQRSVEALSRFLFVVQRKGKEKRIIKTASSHQQRVELLDLVLHVLRQPVELNGRLRDPRDREGVGEELLVLLDEKGDA
jgi:hypothetical protein